MRDVTWHAKNRLSARATTEIERTFSYTAQEKIYPRVLSSHLIEIGAAIRADGNVLTLPEETEDSYSRLEYRAQGL